MGSGIGELEGIVIIIIQACNIASISIGDLMVMALYVSLE